MMRVPLSYWQAHNGQEADFIIGDDIAIEVKATNHVHDKHLNCGRMILFNLSRPQNF